MARRARARVHLLALVVAVAGPGVSTANTDCHLALIQDELRFAAYQDSRYAAIELVNRSESQSRSRDGSVSLPVLDASGNDVRESASEYFRNSELNWTEERLISVATQRLSKNSVDAYKACLEGQHRSGPRILVHDATNEAVTVTVRWLAPVGAPTTTDEVAIEMLNGEFTTPIPTQWRTGQEVALIVRRAPNRDLRIVANIGGEADNEFVAFLPPMPPPRPKQLLIASCRGHGGMNGHVFWGPVGEKCNGHTIWGTYSDNVQAVRALGKCRAPGGYGGFELWGPVGLPCAGLTQWGYYENPVDVYAQGIGACSGLGSFLGGHVFWGPPSQACGGMPWGTKYDNYIKRPE